MRFPAGPTRENPFWEKSILKRDGPEFRRRRFGRENKTALVNAERSRAENTLYLR